MTQGKRPPLRRFLRELSRPIEWISKKAKKASRQDPPLPATTHYVVDPSLTASLAKTDELLLAFMRSSQRQNTVPVQLQTPVTPCQISSGRMLTAHPHADFFVCPTAEIRPLGMLLIQQFDSSLSQTIRESVEPGDRVGILGDFAGYHTLSLASLVGTAGQVISLDEVSDEITLLNLDANLCRNVTRDTEILTDAYLAAVNQFFIRVNAELRIDLAFLGRIRRHAPDAHWHIHVVDGLRSSQETKSKALEIFRCLTEQGMKVEQNGLMIDQQDLGSCLDWDRPCRLRTTDWDVAPRKVG